MAIAKSGGTKSRPAKKATEAHASKESVRAEAGTPVESREAHLAAERKAFSAAGMESIDSMGVHVWEEGPSQNQRAIYLNVRAHPQAILSEAFVRVQRARRFTEMLAEHMASGERQECAYSLRDVLEEAEGILHPLLSHPDLLAIPLGGPSRL